MVDTGKNYTRQPYYSCYTCSSGYGVCVTCRFNCHPQDHNIGWVKVEDMYCDCGASGKCKFMGSGDGDSSSAHVVTCKNGHELGRSRGSISCDICSASGYESYRCAPCNWDMCLACYNSKTLGGSNESASTQTQNAAEFQPSASGRFHCEPNTSAYSSDTGEKWVPGNSRRPFGKFDTTNRKLNSKLRDVFDRWNQWVADSNEPYEEFLTARDYLNEENRDLDCSFNNLNNLLENMGKYVPHMRTVIEDATKLTKSASHPAILRMEEERKNIMSIIRKLREGAEKEYNEAKFTEKVEKPLKNIRLTIRELESSKDFFQGTINIDGYYGEYYYFEGQNGGWRNCDVPRVGLGEVKKAKEALGNRLDHPLAAEVLKLEKELIEIHSEICLKYARHFAADGWMDKSQEYRNSYVQVHGETDALQKLDEDLNQAKDSANKQREIEAEKARLEYEQREREANEERERLKKIWKDRYTAGGTIYCDQEEWSYDSAGLVKLKGSEVYYEWTGYGLSGSVYGSGTWDGTNFYWYYDHRYVYKYQFNGEKFFLDTGKEIPSFSWNGAVLSPENPNDNFRNRLVRCDGEVPPLVCLAIALRLFARTRISECEGEHVCRSALFNEGQQGMLCEKCSTNSRVGCAVCGDYISFPRNIAYCCKYCVTFVGSGCMKCGGSFARVPGFLCDTCQFKFTGNSYCVRTNPH